MVTKDSKVLYAVYSKVVIVMYSFFGTYLFHWISLHAMIYNFTYIVKLN